MGIIIFLIVFLAIILVLFFATKTVKSLATLTLSLAVIGIIIAGIIAVLFAFDVGDSPEIKKIQTTATGAITAVEKAIDEIAHSAKDTAGIISSSETLNKNEKKEENTE